MILTIRTDKPEAEIGLYDDQGTQLAYHTWEAHRKLAETLHQKIQDLLKSAPVKGQTLEDIGGVVVFAGPGSFTGLRIGICVANALAYGCDTPVIAIGGDAWIDDGIRKIRHTPSGQYAVPIYGQPAFTTVQTK